MKYLKVSLFRSWIASCLVVLLSWPQSLVGAQGMALPLTGGMTALSEPFKPAFLSAVAVDPANPLMFDFYIDDGAQIIAAEDQHARYSLLVKDFFTALTIPEQDLWVNLSPYEKDRIIDDHFGLTEMGRDLLAQDYLLKQITASLVYPEEPIGRQFWAEVYRRVQEKYGTTDIAVDTFNKVWIMPDTAEVYQEGTTAMVLSGHLKVMLEKDYLATSNNRMPIGGHSAPSADNNERGSVSPSRLPSDSPMNAKATQVSTETPSQTMAQDAMRSIVIPLLEKEVNEGKNFARLRQIYNALILAAWYKKSMRETLLGKVYVDKAKVKGVEQEDPAENMRIYNKYVETFRAGAFNYIKEEVDRYSGEIIPRKYFSGGFFAGDMAQMVRIVGPGRSDAAQGEKKRKRVRVGIFPRQRGDASSGYNNIHHRRSSVPTKEVNIPDIQKILAHAKAIRDLQPDPFVNDLKGEQRKILRAHKILLKHQVKASFAEYIRGEELADMLIGVFNRIVDDIQETGIQSLILSGEFTSEVFRQFRGLAVFAQTDEAKIPYEQVFRALGLHEDLMDRFITAASSLSDMQQYEQFYEVFNSLRQTLQGRQGILSREIPNELNYLEALRLERGSFPKDPDISAAAGKLAQEAAGDRGRAYHFFQHMMDMLGKHGASADHLIFSRSKTAESILGKLERKDKPKKAYQIHDPNAGRIASPFNTGLSGLVDGVNLINNADHSISLRAFDRKVLHLIKLLDRLQQNGDVRQKHAALAMRTKILGWVDNARDERGRFVVARAVDYFDKTEWWYKAVHMIFYFGRGMKTIEVQFKTMLMTILHDIEHKLKYKSNGDHVSPVWEHLIKYIWLANAVEMANYCKELPGGEELTFMALDQYLFQRDASQAVAVQNGGIDVRSVEDRLHVQGKALVDGRGSFGPSIKMDSLEGFSPQIISVRQVSSIPFTVRAEAHNR